MNAKLHRLTPLVCTAWLVLTGLGVSSVSAQNFDFCNDCTGMFDPDCELPPIAENPPLTALCAEMDIIVIIDESGSISGFENDVENGVLAFVSALVGTGVDMAVIEFDSAARLVSNYAVVDDAFLSGMNNYFDTIPFNGQTYTAMQGTNWMSAMQAAIQLAPADMILFFTDGNPTFWTQENGIVNTCGNGLTTQIPEIVNPVLIANYVKEVLGTHMFMMGVGTADSLRFNLERMSGTTRWEQGNTEFQSSDYTLGNFATLAAELRAFALEICGTEALVDIDADQDSVCVGETVEFVIKVTNNGMVNSAQNLVVRDTFPGTFSNLQILSGSGACLGAACNPGEPSNVLVWDVGDLPVSGMATLTLRATIAAGGTFTIPAWVDGQNIEIVSVSTQVFAVDPPEVSTTVTGEMLCTGGETTITASATGGLGAYSYLWSNNAVTNVITVNPSGTTTYTVTVTDQLGCSDTDAVTVTVNMPPEVSIPGSDTSCFGAPVVLNPAGVAGFDYAWAPAEFLNDPTRPNPIAEVAQSTVFYVTVTDPISGCFVVDSVAIFIPPDVALGAPSDTTYCGTPEIVLNATGPGLSFVWYTSSGQQIGTGSSISVKPETESTYIVEGTDIYGCEVQSTVTLTPTVFDYDISPGATFCEGETAVLSVTDHAGQNLTYQWSPAAGIVGPTDGSSVLVMPDVTTEYTVLITNTDLGCTSTEAFDVTVGSFSPDTVLVFVIDGDITLGETFQLGTNMPDNLLFFWDGPGIINPNLPVITAKPENAGSYAYGVTVTNSLGCKKTGIISGLTVVNPPCNMEDVFVPDAFSPNGDGNNDELFVYGNYISALELHIFNRWGEEVFTTNDQNVGWDGTFKGKELDTDVFGYYLRVECPPNKMYFTKGNITLFK